MTARVLLDAALVVALACGGMALFLSGPNPSRWADMSRPQAAGFWLVLFGVALHFFLLSNSG